MSLALILIVDINGASFEEIKNLPHMFVYYFRFYIYGLTRQFDGLIGPYRIRFTAALFCGL
jgi:hypothetical protein